MTAARETKKGAETCAPTLDRCRVCKGPVDFALTVVEMMLDSRDSFEYVECRLCGCLQIDRIPGDLDRYYAGTYYTRNQIVPHAAGRPASMLRRGWTRFRLGDSGIARAASFRRYGRFDWFRRTRTGVEDTILDVGCGSGRLLNRLHAEGFERLTGIDIHLGDALRAETKPSYHRESVEAHEGRYRLVMSHHSFEHMKDPVLGFAAFSRLVEPGGHLLLRLPMADSWARRHYGANWVQLDAPRHLHLHTRRSIRLLADRYGFRVTHVVDDSGPFQIWGSEAYQRGTALEAAGPKGKAAFSMMERLSARGRARTLSRRGVGDQACFYLERVGA